MRVSDFLTRHRLVAFDEPGANANDQNHHASNSRDIAPALVRKTELQRGGRLPEDILDDLHFLYFSSFSFFKLFMIEKTVLMVKTI